MLKPAGIQHRRLLSRHWALHCHSVRRHAAGWSDAAAAPDASSNLNTAALLSSIRRPVVTAFLQNDKGQVLLVQRSDKVRTYQHMWGGVSGGLEPGDDLLERAKQEVFEEVGISAEQLQLVGTGRPLKVDDADRHFLVHPFLFKLLEPPGGSGNGIVPDQIQLNWENVGYRWLEPSEMLSLPTVPRLAATLQRVILPHYTQQHVTHMLHNRSHGAAELARDVVQAFQAIECYECSHDPGLTGEDQLELYYDFAYQLATSRPSMAAIANAVVEVLKELDAELCARAEPFEPPAGHVRLALSNAAEKVMHRLDRLQHDQLANGVAVLGQAQQIMTLSYSSTILRVLLQAAAGGSGGTGLKPHVVVLESRPLCEGVKLAQQLGEHGLPVTLITDAQAAAFMNGTQAVLVGADAVMEEGVVNKVGTYLIALAAQSKGIPVYVLADSMKISPGPVVTATLQHLGPWQSAVQKHTWIPAEEKGSETGKEAAVSTAPETEAAPAPATGEGTAPVPAAEAAPIPSFSQAAASLISTSAGSTPADVPGPLASSSMVAPSRSAMLDGCVNALLEEKEPSELYAAWTKYSLKSDLVTVRNLYFELLPWSLVGAVITDKGVMSVDSIQEAVVQLRQAYVESFRI